MTDVNPEFHPLLPGERIAGDWFDRAVPSNLEIGPGTVVDSSHAFYFYKSTLACGLRTGKNVVFWRTSLSVGEQAVISIGDDCYFANASLVCEAKITIGNRVLVGIGVTIADSDFHPVAPAERIADTIALAPGGDRSTRPTRLVRPVHIGDDVRIGPNAAILKGVTIGNGAEIAAGSVVLHDVPAGARVAGNPARPEPSN
jgi:acetyltransferase-like isoleucine patch superfamily enzyme